jgi:hypothetical protein
MGFSVISMCSMLLSSSFFYLYMVDCLKIGFLQIALLYTLVSNPSSVLLLPAWGRLADINMTTGG